MALSDGDQVTVNRPRDHDGLATGIDITSHTAGDSYRLGGGKQVIVERFTGRAR
jgi:hypothetical protein